MQVDYNLKVIMIQVVVKRHKIGFLHEPRLRSSFVFVITSRLDNVRCRYPVRYAKRVAIDRPGNRPSACKTIITRIWLKGKGEKAV